MSQSKQISGRKADAYNGPQEPEEPSRLEIIGLNFLILVGLGGALALMIALLLATPNHTVCSHWSRIDKILSIGYRGGTVMLTDGSVVETGGVRVGDAYCERWSVLPGRIPMDLPDTASRTHSPR